jgi:hypothetical protein
MGDASSSADKSPLRHAVYSLGFSDQPKMIRAFCREPSPEQHPLRTPYRNRSKLSCVHTTPPFILPNKQCRIWNKGQVLRVHSLTTPYDIGAPHHGSFEIEFAPRSAHCMATILQS